MGETKNIYELLRESAGKHSNRELFVHGDRRITYSQALAEVDALAAGLQKRGIQKGQAFILALRNSPEFVFMYLALARLGAIAVPVNFMVSKADELEYMLKDARAVGVFTQKEFLRAYQPLKARCGDLKVWVGLDCAPEGGETYAALLAEGAKAPLTADSVPAPGDLVCYLFTSGTTGSPKGAMLTHSNQLSNCDAAVKALEVGRKDVFLDILPMFHTFAWMACVLVPIRLGARVVIISSLTPPTPWLKAMGKEGVTLFAAVPQIYAVLAKEAKGFKRLFLRYYSFRKVRAGVSGAAPLSTEVLSAFESKLGVPILEGYGLTETSPVVSINTLHGRRPGTVGRPIEKVEVKVVDDEERELAQGQEGELVVRGPNIMKGYNGKPEATKEAFTKDGQWFKTGDVAAIDPDGYISIRDRKKDMIIVKGLKVFPAMVESVILGHPAVAEAAVIGVPEAGTGDETIRAYVTLKDGSQAEKSELMAFIRGKLDPYKRPRDLEIVESLPKNALQKVLKRELRKQALAKLAQPAA